MPIDASNAPSEIGALIASLNGLFGRVRTLIDREREFTADAAHELRTPLAAIRAQAQVARGAEDARERARALDGVMGGCDRAAHLVEQMLTLARLEPDATSFRRAPVQLAAVLKETIGDLAPSALAQRIEIELRQEQPASVLGDAGLLRVLFRNLIDNAIRYSPAATTVTVDAGTTATEARVVITDAGPGIPFEQREHIGRRFYRPPGTQASGSGLGLSIVRRILELHGGAMQFDTPATGRGLQVSVVLPAAQAHEHDGVTGVNR